jgi:hypothetical protein
MRTVRQRRGAPRRRDPLTEQGREAFQTLVIPSRQIRVEAGAQVPGQQTPERQHRGENHRREQDRQGVHEAQTHAERPIRN